MLITFKSGNISANTGSVELPTMKWTPDLIADYCTADCQMCAQMRTIGVQNIRFSRVSAKDNQIFAENMKCFDFVWLQVIGFDDWIPTVGEICFRLIYG